METFKDNYSDRSEAAQLREDFESRIIKSEQELPMISPNEIPLGAKSMLASIREGFDGNVIAVARVIVPENHQTGLAQSEYKVYMPYQPPKAVNRQKMRV